LQAFFEYIGKSFIEFSFLDGLEIILLSVFIYCVSIYVKKNNALWYNKFLAVFLVASVLVGVSTMKSARIFFAYMPLLLPLVTLIIFSADIKRDIWRLSRHRHKLNALRKTDFNDDDLRHSTAEILRATQNMAKENIGALVVFSRQQFPAQIIESGVVIDGGISSQILESLFFPNSALHDGAVVITGNRIVAAGCFLPLSLELNLPKDLGTRHRAAIGITESVADVVSLVVSDETGIISIAYQGKMHRYLDTQQLTMALEAALGLKDIDTLPFFKGNKANKASKSNGENL
jgi:diadenylate cyclase